MNEPKEPDNFNNWDDIDIYLFSNGQQYSPPRKYHLRNEELNRWTDVLNYLARSQYGYLHSSIDLYTVGGKKINGPMELQNGIAYVAVDTNDTFIPAGYDQYLIKASSIITKICALPEQWHLHKIPYLIADFKPINKNHVVILEAREARRDRRRDARRKASWTKRYGSNSSKYELPKAENINNKTENAETIEVNGDEHLQKSKTQQSNNTIMRKKENKIEEEKEGISKHQPKGTIPLPKASEKKRPFLIQRSPVEKKKLSTTVTTSQFVRRPTLKRKNIPTKKNILSARTGTESAGLEKNNKLLVNETKFPDKALLVQDKEITPVMGLPTRTNAVIGRKQSLSLISNISNRQFLNHTTKHNTVLDEKEPQSTHSHANYAMLALPDRISKTSQKNYENDITGTAPPLTPISKPNEDKITLEYSEEPTVLSNNKTVENNDLSVPLSNNQPIDNKIQLTADVTSQELPAFKEFCDKSTSDSFVAVVNESNMISLKLNIEVNSANYNVLHSSNKPIPVEKRSQVDLSAQQNHHKVIFLQCNCCNQHFCDSDVPNIADKNKDKNNKDYIVFLPQRQVPKDLPGCVCDGCVCKPDENIQTTDGENIKMLVEKLYSSTCFKSNIENELVTNVIKRDSPNFLEADKNGNEQTSTKQKITLPSKENMDSENVIDKNKPISAERYPYNKNREFTIINENSLVKTEKVMLDKSTQTEENYTVLEARCHKDGHYTFHFPPLDLLKYYDIS